MRLLGRMFVVGSIVLASLLVMTCASLPVRWQFKDESPWRVRVVDKTVPHRNFREHAALFWVLRHEKASTPQGQRDWDLQEDYVGFYPVADRAQPSSTADPDGHGGGRELRARDLEQTDMLYLADTYGVYTGDYEQRGQAGRDYSQLIFGGMTGEEVGLVEDFVADGGALVAEFNTFASPTGGSTRQRLERLLGVTWSGWTGRHFENLADLTDVPIWARREWRNHYDEEWDFRGPGYLLVHEDSRLFVLQEDLDVGDPGLTLGVTAENRVTNGLLSNIAFKYWFDIVIPDPSTQVLAEFRFEADESGRELLDRFGVPDAFPAVLLASESPLRMYLAGDFSDAVGSLGPYWAEGMPWLNKKMVSVWFPRSAEQEPFYWGFYIPLLRNLLLDYSPTR